MFGENTNVPLIYKHTIKQKVTYTELEKYIVTLHTNKRLHTGYIINS